MRSRIFLEDGKVYVKVVIMLYFKKLKGCYYNWSMGSNGGSKDENVMNI